MLSKTFNAWGDVWPFFSNFGPVRTIRVQGLEHFPTLRFLDRFLGRLESEVMLSHTLSSPL